MWGVWMGLGASACMMQVQLSVPSFIRAKAYGLLYLSSALSSPKSIALAARFYYESQKKPSAIGRASRDIAEDSCWLSLAVTTTVLQVPQRSSP